MGYNFYLCLFLGFFQGSLKCSLLIVDNPGGDLCSLCMNQSDQQRACVVATV